MSRFTLFLVPLFAAIAAVAAACGGADDSSFAYRGNGVQPPFEMPDAVLEDTSGRLLDLRKETAGFATLLYVGYTNCPDVCPTHFAAFTGALKELDPAVRDRVKVVFISTDPERDTGPVLRRWLDAFDSRYIGLRTDTRALAEFLASLSMPVSQHVEHGGGAYEVPHATFVIGFTKDGTGRLLYPDGTTTEDWKHDLPLLVREDWK